MKVATLPTYEEMISDCLLTLKEKKGSTRQEIWKLMQIKFPESDYKKLLFRLKKLKLPGSKTIVADKRGVRFMLSKEY